MEEHPFTISSSPTEPAYVASTIKQSGDFTSLLGHVAIGDRVAVRGPFGRFCHLLHPKESDLVFIAGGVGITPLMSMLRYMRDAGKWKPTLLIDCNRSQGDILFRSELEEMAETSNAQLSVIHVLSDAESAWDGECGHIDGELIQRHVGAGLSSRAFYVCGPAALTRAVTSDLRRLGVPAGRIHSEMFNL